MSLSGFLKRSVYQIQKLLHNKNLRKRLQKEVICRQTDTIMILPFSALTTQMRKTVDSANNERVETCIKRPRKI
jgi:hypothetical protein